MIYYWHHPSPPTKRRHQAGVRQYDDDPNLDLPEDEQVIALESVDFFLGCQVRSYGKCKEPTWLRTTSLQVE